eukprot:TRINITY_DN24824_c0_g1_i1.p2 TRINITY_DN24824_c0_g1~~TRINITY_DN24824_c0_g1_i1.p2  ORF type:complete len:189 (+),score=77.05 TRINITY_DN24824_c0_g1_i1:69-635(+)
MLARRAVGCVVIGAQRVPALLPLAARRWCSAPAPPSPPAAASIEEKISKQAEADPSLMHLENDGKTMGANSLGGSGVGPKGADLALMFECRVCKTTAMKQFSRHSYEHGVVLIECPGCKNKHIIADNLGWFSDMGENNNIEKQMKAEGQELERRSVTPEQYKQILQGGIVDQETGELRPRDSEKAKDA